MMPFGWTIQQSLILILFDGLVGTGLAIVDTHLGTDELQVVFETEDDFIVLIHITGEVFDIYRPHQFVPEPAYDDVALAGDVGHHVSVRGVGHDDPGSGNVGDFDQKNFFPLPVRRRYFFLFQSSYAPFYQG